MRRFALISMVFGLMAGTAPAQNGHLMTGYGPINLSMGGASAGNAMDSMGILFWNPAGIGRLGRSEISFSTEAFFSTTTLSSSVNANSFGAGAPPVDLSGSTDGDFGVSPIPSFAIVGKWDESSPWTMGVGAFGLGGFGVDYAADSGNPILTPQPSKGGMGFGSLYSNFQLLQVSPTFGYRVNDKLSLGFAPNFAWASLSVDPMPAAAPDDANGDGKGTYPSATHAATALGFSLTLGVYYQATEDLSLGFSLKTPTWMEDFEFNAVNELGAHRKVKFGMDVPAILSVGLGYTGFDRWTLAADLRYIDYSNTDGFEKKGFDSVGAVKGFGWDSILVFAAGAQYQATDKFSVRAGLTLNQNPISDDQTFFNLVAPAIIQTHLNLGFSYDFSEKVKVSFAYHRGLENSISGPWYSGLSGNAIPGTRVESKMHTDGLLMGVSIKF
jgi:long-chain fatty acid transport protein